METLSNFSIVALIAFVAFQQYLRHHRRIMIHRERLAALAKGVDMPPVEQEIQQTRWNIQRLLLLAGLSWISIGIGAYVMLGAMVGRPGSPIPEGLQWIVVPLVGIGLSHLVVYVVGLKREG
jgi:hypothetical protein